MRISAVILVAILTLPTACQKRRPNAVINGDAERGAAAILRYGCGACHTIAKLRYAHGLVGPPLTNISARMYVAGVLQNNPENMIRWIQNPKAVDEKTAMPNLGVTPKDAIDIAAYLYSY